MQIGQRVAIAGMLVSGALALIKIVAGLAGHSTAVVADGLESAGDVIASGFVLFGLTLAAKPADETPYGHGRIETLTGLVIARPAERRRADFLDFASRGTRANRWLRS